MKKMIRKYFHSKAIRKLFLLVVACLIFAGGMVFISNFDAEPSLAAEGDFTMLDQQPFFAANVTPKFKISSAGMARGNENGSALNSIKTSRGEVGVQVLDDENRAVDLTTSLNFDGRNDSDIAVSIMKSSTFRPGRYLLETTIKNGSNDVTLKQDFLWGVLAINLDQSSYEPGSTVTAMLAVLNDGGVTLCDANLDLAITDPSGQETRRTSASGEIVTSPICEDKRVTDTPDYSTSFTVHQIGHYQISLTADTKNGRRFMRTSFEVISNPDFIVSRPATSMRIYPPYDYTVKIDLNSKNGFSGSIIETAPDSFTIKNAHANIIHQGVKATTQDIESKVVDGRQTMRWDNINLNSGDSVHIEYTYRAPPISPEFYLLGPLELIDQFGQMIFTEPRAWQIASDAVVTWDGGGTDGTCGGVAGDGNKWSCTINWSGDALPTSADVATFDSTSTKNANITVAIGTISGIDIKTGYSGTITNQVTSGTAVTLSASFAQVTGTFDGGTTATIDDNGTFSLTGGTFTSTSGNFQVASTFSISGTPTFTHNSGTFTFDASSATLTPSTVTFYKVSFGSAVTKTIVNSQTMTVANTLTLTDGSIDQTTRPTAGSIAAGGDVTQATTFDGGTSKIVLSGTGTQTFTGGGSATSGNLPDIDINSTGYIALVSIIRTTNDWIYTKGGISEGTSTVVFVHTADISLSGSMIFYNLTLRLTTNITATLTISSGSTVEVNGTLTLHATDGAGNLDGPGAISARGDVTITGDATDSGWGGTANMTINGTGAQALTGTTDTGGAFNRVPGLTINKPSGTLTLANEINVRDNFTYKAGKVDIGTSTVRFYTTPTITGSITLNNVTFAKTGTTSAAIAIASDTILSVAGTLTLDHTNATGTETINGPGSITALGNVSVSGSSGTTGFNGNVAVTFAGSSNTTFTTNTTTFPTGDVVVNKSTGYKVSLLAATTFASSSQDLTISSGTLDLDGFDLSVNGLLALLIVNSGGNLQFAGSELIFLDVGSGSAPQLNSGSTVTYDGTAASYNVKNYTYINLTFAGAASTVFTLVSNATSIETLTITTGIFALGGFNLTATTLANDDTLRRQGNETVSITTMDTDSGTVQYIGRNIVENLTIKDFGASDYYNLTFNDANASKATFQS